MATAEQLPEHQRDDPQVPLRDALRRRRVAAWIAIIGQATAAILVLYGTAPLSASLPRWPVPSRRRVGMAPCHAAGHCGLLLRLGSLWAGSPGSGPSLAGPHETGA